MNIFIFNIVLKIILLLIYKIDKIFADVLQAEKAAVRLQLVSGTHAIASSLFGVLRPGDNFLSIR